MTCPHCDVNLLMSERQGVEIDYCPQCRGVWLDRGELDKIVERSHAEMVGPRGGVRATAAPAPSRDDDRDRHREDDRRGYEQPAYAKKKKRSSFLEDIFDF
jgi:uncharacterized protein